MFSFIKKIIPSFAKRYANRWRLKRKISESKQKQKQALHNLSNKKVINCVFFALFEEIWKYDTIYRLMEQNPRFNPIILVCPIVNYGHENMINRMEHCFSSFKIKGYRVIRSYNTHTDSYIDVRKALDPDIIFYTNPYKSLIDGRYYISNFMDKLTVYVPYYMNSNKDYQLSSYPL